MRSRNLSGIVAIVVHSLHAPDAGALPTSGRSASSKLEAASNFDDADRPLVGSAPASGACKECTTMATIPDKFLDLMQNRKAFAHLATVMQDGTPQVTPVWFDYGNGVLRVNTAKG